MSELKVYTKEEEEKRDELVVKICWHVDRGSEWSKLSQQDFAEILYQEYKDVASRTDIEEVISYVRRRWSKEN